MKHRSIALLVIVLGVAGSAWAASVEQAKARCVEKKMEADSKQNAKSGPLSGNNRFKAQMACNVEFQPCDEDPASARCKAVVNRYSR